MRNSSSFVPVDVYHPPTQFLVNQNVKFLDETEHRQYNFRKANYEQVIEAIGGINWNFIHLLSADQALHQFYNLINGIIRGFVPLYRENKHPSWYNLELIKLLKKKDSLRRKWKRNSTTENYDRYSDLRAQYKIKIKTCYKQYIQYLQDNIKNNIKLFWSFSKSKKKTRNSYPTTIQYNNTSARTPADISEVFSSYFQTTFSNITPSNSNFSTINEVRPIIEITKHNL